MSDEQVIYVVVRYHAWDKDEYIAGYLTRKAAEQHRDQLNEGPYDPDDAQDYKVWTIPWLSYPPSTEKEVR